MPAYYYITSTGLAGGDAGRFESLQTGAFDNASSYASIAAARAATTPPAKGDYYLISHSTSLSVADVFLATADHGVTLMSMDNSNRDAYLAGATITSTVDLDPAVANIRIHGIGLVYDIGDDSDFAAANFHGFYEDSKFNFPNTSTDAPTFAAGSHGQSRFRDCELNITAASASGLSLGGSTYVELDNCRNVTGAARAALVTGLSTNTRSIIVIRNTDLTQFISASGSLIEDNLTSGMSLHVIIDRCKLPTGFTVFAGTKADALWYEVTITESDQGDGYHYFFYENPFGQVEEDTTQYLDATYDGTNGFSWQVDTTALASKGQPFRYKIGILPASDLATANQTVGIELTGPALTDTEAWIDCVINNDTDEAKGDVVTTRNSALMAAGTALATSSETWQDGAQTEQSISKDLGAFTNVDNGSVEVWINVADPSATINFDMPTIAAT